MTIEQMTMNWMAKRIDNLESALVKADFTAKQWRQTAEFLQDTIDRELPLHEHSTIHNERVKYLIDKNCGTLDCNAVYAKDKKVALIFDDTFMKFLNKFIRTAEEARAIDKRTKAEATDKPMREGD